MMLLDIDGGENNNGENNNFSLLVVWVGSQFLERSSEAVVVAFKIEVSIVLQITRYNYQVCFSYRTSAIIL